MDERTELQRIGDGLDSHVPVRVKNKGIVVLDDTSPNESVQETQNEQQRKPQRPSARQRQRPTRRKGASRRPRSSGSQSRVVNLTDAYLSQEGKLTEAYPGATLIPDKHGVWLIVESQILTDFDRTAFFAIALPDSGEVEPRGWAFWKTESDLRWIGRRHTNMVDGSVCAFHPKYDGAWAPGGDLRTLLDIYSVWALRHLHLEVIGRWPGRQYAMPDDAGRCDPYYRLVEFQAEELCSCGSDRRYGECCRPSDLRLPFLEMKKHFDRRSGGARLVDRSPPTMLVTALTGQMSVDLPPMAETHLVLRQHLKKQSEAKQ